MVQTLKMHKDQRQNQKQDAPVRQVVCFLVVHSRSSSGPVAKCRIGVRSQQTETGREMLRKVDPETRISPTGSSNHTWVQEKKGFEKGQE